MAGIIGDPPKGPKHDPREDAYEALLQAKKKLASMKKTMEKYKGTWLYAIYRSAYLKQQQIVADLEKQWRKLNPTPTPATPGQGGEGEGAGEGGDDGAAAAAADAYALIKGMLDKWGIGSLADAALKLAQQGYTTNQILLMLRDTQEYKTRFAGNEQRIKNGYAALDPDEYLAVEDAYQRVLQSYGLPKGFYDQNSDFNDWIGNNVSAAEVENRAQIASNAVNNTDPFFLQALGATGLMTGDLVANVLDQKRSLPILQRIVGSSQIGAAALRNNLAFDQNRAGYWYDRMGGQVNALGVDRAYSEVAAALPAARKLSHLYGENLGQDTLEDEYLGGSEKAASIRRRLGIRELGNFSGQGGAGEKSVSTGGRGTF